jgi:hypothetical protein
MTRRIEDHPPIPHMYEAYHNTIEFYLHFLMGIVCEILSRCVIWGQRVTAIFLLIGEVHALVVARQPSH